MAEIGQDIIKAKSILETSGLVAIPTETVYGLAGNAIATDAVTKIFKVKKRPAFDPLIVHTDSIEKLQNYVASIPEKAYQLAEKFWPGPLTLLLPKLNIIPDLVTSGLEKVAVRVPDHHLTLSLLASLDFPLAAPSANPFGYISPTNPGHVDDQLGRQIPYILDGGQCKVGIESTIIGFEKEKPVIYRTGGITIEAIEQAVGSVSYFNGGNKTHSPGLMKSHYAPSKLLLLGDISQLLPEFNPDDVGLITFNKHYSEINKSKQFVLSKTSSLEEAANQLFTAMRTLDRLPVKVILAEPVPDTGLGRAINDRLKKAATK